MEDTPPPPPPPHGSNPKPARSGGLPDGKYDIFVIPPSSAGSGFLYLPSLQTQRNSFLAGCACTALAFFLYSVAIPVVKEWCYTTLNGGGSGILMVILAVGVVSWALGKTQGEGTSGSKPTGSQKTYTEAPPKETPGPPPREPTPPPATDMPKSTPQSPPPKSSWQRTAPSGEGKSAWEKAREETRKREEERKRAEELKRRREELEKERVRQREKETLERLEREWKEKKAKEDEAAKKAEEELKAKQAKDEVDKRVQREKERREREAREALLQAAKEAREAKEALDRTRAEESARKIAEADAAKIAAERSSAKGNSKRPPMPSARTERDDDAYSFRPYDRKDKSSAGSVYSDDSYAASATTAKTTPPGSTRGPYTTKDPDKIIIKGVYSFNNAFMRTPISQLISGQGAVTDGLILRITTEGLFIDDDVRGIPQREWDIKAWTMKQAEVC